MVAEELRAGYLYRDKVLRPSLVSVSVKPQKKSEEAADAPEAIKINISENIEED